MKELMEKIGKKGLIYAGGLRVEVTVIDVKTSYGKIRYQVSPTAGEGEIWIESISFYK